MTSIGVVKLVFPVVAFFCIAVAVFAGGGIFNGKYEIQVDAASQCDKENEKAFCKDYSIDERKAKIYFTHAKNISSWEYTHKYDWTNCYASGRAILDGKELKWEIRRGGLGKLMLPSGDVALLVCEAKQCREW